MRLEQIEKSKTEAQDKNAIERIRLLKEKDFESYIKEV